MAEHRLEDRDPGNTSDPNEALTEEFDPDELAEILRRFNTGADAESDVPPAGTAPEQPGGGAA